MLSKRGVSLCCVLACWMGGLELAQAEEAAPTDSGAPEQVAPADEAPPTEAQTTAPESGTEQPQRPPGASAPAVSESVVRFGRVEMVLIENEDAESALEFGQELLTQDGESPQIRLLLAACLMTLNRPADALEHLSQAVRLSENNPTLQLHALYNTARALHAAGQFREAADAYERYVTFARTHGDLTAFADEAQRLARVLRARVSRRP